MKGTVVTAFYQSIAQNMTGLPIYNHELQVEVTSFIAIEQNWLGVVVTPWCMNIVLLPDVISHGNIQRKGAKFIHTFPSGQYEFIRAYNSSLGDYATCSLFSPMFEFSTHQAAIETAQEVLAELFKENNNIPSELQISNQKYQVKSEAKTAVEISSNKHSMNKSQNKEQPGSLSRRGFITGKFWSQEGNNS